MFILKFVGYCGMSGMPEHFEDAQEAREAAAAAIKRARAAGIDVATLEAGESWEFLEPEDCAMVPDDAGFLYLIHRVFECRECGCNHETKDGAAECCSGMFDDFADVEEESEDAQEV